LTLYSCLLYKDIIEEEKNALPLVI
jgi:hypothetical protein